MRFLKPATLAVLFFLYCQSGFGQQRPLAAEDPQVIPNGALDVRVGFGWEKRAVYPISGIEGNHVAVVPAALSFGVADRVEFQFEGVVQDYVKDAANVWRHDVGDLAVSSKVLLTRESGAMPAFAFRTTMILPNANQASGLGLNTLRFFSALLVGKTAGSAYIYGGAGLGILEDATHVAAQQDVLTGSIGARIALSPRVSAIAEFDGLHNPRTPPSPGSESRGEARLGVRIKAGGMTWNAAALGGVTRVDPPVGFTMSVTRRFTLPGS
ncbi:MAG TPA: hypothetical protein VFY29_18260 [Terriglobia bacterium]|nr:hypothetical protein [Terriglobia bacterium]